MTFIAGKKGGMVVVVRVQGEHLGPKEYVVAYGTVLAELMAKVERSPRSDFSNTQLFRESVRAKQAWLMARSLSKLRNSIIDGESAPNNMTRVHEDDASIVLQWIERALSVEPCGQVVVGSGAHWHDFVLENEDVVNVPPLDGMVRVVGEVHTPKSIAYQPELEPDMYIQRAGGFTKNADRLHTIVVHKDGTFVDSRHSTVVQHGDKIMVLPKVTLNSAPVAKDLFTILYQIATFAKVVVRLQHHFDNPSCPLSPHETARTRLATASRSAAAHPLKGR
ncbi:Polysialic acid transport protein KpsD [Paraburkholderia humisilvae]|uniref:Polysialic acid transport protein KpsD n=2 Tax=Paraburkholderia humisilvae TaxID=627669 RepID=A0A6J5F8K3_9BURK|nr:Polysialic acid transport protein KpsD [Paraburkholderia humisilvae]